MAKLYKLLRCLKSTYHQAIKKRCSRPNRSWKSAHNAATIAVSHFANASLGVCHHVVHKNCAGVPPTKTQLLTRRLSQTLYVTTANDNPTKQTAFLSVRPSTSTSSLRWSCWPPRPKPSWWPYCSEDWTSTDGCKSLKLTQTSYRLSKLRVLTSLDFVAKPMSAVEASWAPVYRCQPTLPQSLS